MVSQRADPSSTEELRAKYLAERDKRLVALGNEQYTEVVGDYARYADDPWANVVERAPMTDDVNVVFVGGGFAGLLGGAKLKEAGIADVRIIEKGGDFGGTWYWNRYPGAQCDTASLIYLPLLEETGHMPTEKYAHAPEILEHCRRIAQHYELYDNALLSTEVTEVEWDPAITRWRIRTNRGDDMTAKYVVLGTGPLHRPKLPGVPGITSFTGHTFHTSRWDYDYTGGDPSGALLDGLRDKRVGLIGTGATSVQCVPHLARAAQDLFVFQRTPSSIDARNNHDIDPEWFDTLEPGWQDRWLHNFCILQTGGFADEDLVMDGWTDISQRIRDRVLANAEQGAGFTPADMEQAYHDSDDEKMAEIRLRVDTLVHDPVTAAALKPWYRQLCKRPCFHDEYLQAFNEPGVNLVDTDGKGVERITEKGIVANGVEYELDLIIYASGFEVGTDYARRSGFDMVGRDGMTLSEHWSDGMLSLHGMHMAGFPNAFLVGPAQAANLISNIPHNMTDAATTIAAILTHAQAIGADTIEVTPEAEAAWVAMLEAGERSFGGNPDCTPGYYNNEGHDPGRAGLLGRLGYPDGPVAFFDYIKAWRETGDFAGLDFT